MFIDIKKTAERIQSMYPDVKVIVSEVTPRMDSEDLDKEVKVCNELLNDFVNQSEHTFIVRNSNLRDRKFFLEDGKHLRQNTIARFASNIKMGPSSGIWDKVDEYYNEYNGSNIQQTVLQLQKEVRSQRCEELAWIWNR